MQNMMLEMQAEYAPLFHTLADTLSAIPCSLALPYLQFIFKTSTPHNTRTLLYICYSYIPTTVRPVITHIEQSLPSRLSRVPFTKQASVKQNWIVTQQSLRN